MNKYKLRIPLFLLLLTVLLSLFSAKSLIFPVETFSQTENTALSYFQQGKKYKESGILDKALEAFKKAVKENANYEDAHFAMGVVYYKLNRLDNAILAFNEVLRINPDSRETHNNLAVLYEQLGDYERAMTELQETVRLDPEYTKGHLNLAKLYFARSIQEYFKVIQSNDQEDTRDIRKKLHNLLKSDLKNPDLQYNLGILHRIEGNNDLAEKSLRNAAKLDGDYGNRVTLELANLYEETDQPEKAFDEYTRLLKSDEYNVGAAYAAGRIKNQLKDYSKAETYLQKARALQRTPEIDYELGRAHHGLGRLEEAIASYTSALEQTDNPEVYWSLGQAYKDQKEYTKAVREFEAILDSYPDKEKVQKEIVAVTRLRLAAATPQTDTAETPPPAVTARTNGHPEDLIPSALIGLEREKDVALLVDKSDQTLILYKQIGGKMSHVKNYACSTGENKGEKFKNGDKKTPEGIYLFTHVKSEKELLPEYGKMAFPMDYPNFYDRKHNKDGNGIWLHSTNEPLRAYLPQKTRGCVVVNNSDIQELSQMIRLRETPIIIFDKIPYVSAASQEGVRQDILGLLNAWKESWVSKDVDRFIRFYSPSFTNKNMDLAAWKKYKRSVFKRTKNISLNFTPLQILKHDDYLTITFQQDYRADKYSDKGIKRLFLVFENSAWRIIGEEWRKI